jgi:hypothetical protein
MRMIEYTVSGEVSRSSVKHILRKLPIILSKKTLTESDINIIKRMVAQSKTPFDRDLCLKEFNKKCPLGGYKITPEQTAKGLAWLLVQSKRNPWRNIAIETFDFDAPTTLNIVKQIINGLTEFRLMDFRTLSGDEVRPGEDQLGQFVLPEYAAIGANNTLFCYYVLGSTMCVTRTHLDAKRYLKNRSITPRA